MTERIDEAAIQNALRVCTSLHSWRQRVKGWSLADFEYAADRHANNPNLSNPLMRGEWIEQCNLETRTKEETARLIEQLSLARVASEQMADQIRDQNAIHEASYREQRESRDAQTKREDRRFYIGFAAGLVFANLGWLGPLLWGKYFS